MSGDLLLRDVEVHGFGRGDCRIAGGIVTDVAPRLIRQPGEPAMDGGGGALLPGLADHHLHLAAMAARATSVDLSAVSRGDLVRVLADARPDAGGWIRAVGYDDELHGELDRRLLDALVRTPLRIQHRSGALWVINSAGLDRLGAAADHDGRLWRVDSWLRDALGPEQTPSLRELGAGLAALGITHVADATPDAGTAALVAAAVESGDLPQHVMLMAPDLEPFAHPRLSIGPVKLVVTDHELPDLDDLTKRMQQAHDQHRPVAVHCVTRAALALTLAALDGAGQLDGDRIEHCAVADLALAREVAARGLRVVTQPTLVASRGDDYWHRSEPADRADLWPFASLLRAGVRVVPSSDAPYGDPDPWAGIRAAAARATPSGRILGEHERVSPMTALDGMLSPLHDPGGPARTIAPGRPADLVLLDRPLSEALRDPDAGQVRATLIGGAAVFEAADR